MHPNILYNGALIDAACTPLSPGQAGLLNGWGVFSTIRVYDGVMFEWPRHWDRMAGDAARLRVPFPENSSALEADLYRLIAANRNLDTVVRVTVARNHGGLWQGPRVVRPFDVIGYTREVTKWDAVAKLDLVPHARNSASPFSGTKSMSWAENLTLYERSREKSLDDALLLNERGEISECTSANIFLVNKTRVWTPPLSSGCLPGITRALLLEQIRVPGIEVLEHRVLPADVERADEVFITSSTRELIPVSYIDGLQIQGGHEIRDRLQTAFTEYVTSYVAEHRVESGVTQGRTF